MNIIVTFFANVTVGPLQRPDVVYSPVSIGQGWRWWSLENSFCLDIGFHVSLLATPRLMLCFWCQLTGLPHVHPPGGEPELTQVR